VPDASPRGFTLCTSGARSACVGERHLDHRGHRIGGRQRLARAACAGRRPLPREADRLRRSGRCHPIAARECEDMIGPPPLPWHALTRPCAPDEIVRSANPGAIAQLGQDWALEALGQDDYRSRTSPSWRASSNVTPASCARSRFSAATELAASPAYAAAVKRSRRPDAPESVPKCVGTTAQVRRNRCPSAAGTRAQMRPENAVGLVNDVAAAPRGCCGAERHRQPGASQADAKITRVRRLRFPSSAFHPRTP